MSVLCVVQQRQTVQVRKFKTKKQAEKKYKDDIREGIQKKKSRRVHESFVSFVT
jgi:hypothetical protein